MKMHADPRDLQTIPGVGPSIADDLRKIGINRVADLRGTDPEALYRKSNAAAGATQDRCLLYVFRCAVYFAEGGTKPGKLKWWNWKDRPDGDHKRFVEVYKATRREKLITNEELKKRLGRR